MRCRACGHSGGDAFCLYGLGQEIAARSQKSNGVAKEGGLPLLEVDAKV